MASTSHNSSPHGSVKYNHFHEYDSDNEELFQIREMTISPEPIAIVPIPAPAQTRVSKLKQAIGMSILRKRSQRKTEDDEPAKGTTLPRPSKEREEYLKELADQTWGRGKYYREPDTSKPEGLSDEPEPKLFTSATFPRRAKSVRWNAHHEIQNIQNVRFENTPQGETKTADSGRGHERQKSREDNPNWLEEFELPEPTLTNPLEAKRDSDPDDYFNIKELFADKATTPPLEEPTPWISPLAAKFPQRTTCETVPDEDPTTPPLAPVWNCQCGRTTCTKASVHTLTEEGVRSSLGHEVADSIAKELLFRVGLPPPLPLKNPLAQEALLLREKEVIENYATWAAICLFQKLVLSIKTSLDIFKSNHRGVISFDFEDYAWFQRLDPKARYLVIVEMVNVFNACVEVLHDIRPVDVDFRKKIMGKCFWAQGQEYRITPTGLYNGILLDYRIKRGGPDFRTKHLAKGGRATL